MVSVDMPEKLENWIVSTPNGYEVKKDTPEDVREEIKKIWEEVEDLRKIKLPEEQRPIYVTVSDLCQHFGDLRIFPFA